MALVVVGTSPFADVSVAVGPFRSEARALAASEALEYCGYVTEVCPLQRAEDIEPLEGAGETGL